MNEDFLRYKTRFITLTLLLGYAFMHVKLTGVYFKATFDKLANFSAPITFGQRLLIPLFAHVISYFTSLDLDKIYFLIEWIFISLFYFALLRLMQYEFTLRQAQLLSWLFLLLLPLMTVINYRFTTDGPATFFFYYDSPSLFFLTLGFLFCLRSHWLYFLPLLFVATINRESSLLLILFIPALHWNHLHAVYKQIILSLAVYVLARSLVLIFLHDSSGTLLEWYFKSSSDTHFKVNFQWLLNEQHIFLFIFCFAGLPFFWFAFYDYIPLLFRPLRYVALFYFIVLLVIGNFPEVRIFSEIVLMLYLPVCIALKSWINHRMPVSSEVTTGMLYYIDRYFVLATLALITAVHHSLNQWVIWLSRF